MRHIAAIGLVLALIAPAAWADPSRPGTITGGVPAAAETAVIVAAGGTPLTNGLFFPGTELCNGKDCYSVPMQIEKGTNIRFVNVDVAQVAGPHQIMSLRRSKKTGRPFFQSRLVDGPGEDMVKTSHLKVGEYPYFCVQHAGMNGVIQVVRG